VGQLCKCMCFNYSVCNCISWQTYWVLITSCTSYQSYQWQDTASKKECCGSFSKTC